MESIPGKNFGFPYPNPYPVQIDLMKSITCFLKSDDKVGLFESPTGTGKSLSMLCSILAHQFGIEQPTDDWLDGFAKNSNGLLQAECKKRVLSHLSAKDIGQVKQNLKLKRESQLVQKQQDEDAKFCLNYDSEEEKKKQLFNKISYHAKNAVQQKV